MDDELWKRDLFMNDNILYLFNREIYEYDLQEAGFNLARSFHLLPDAQIARLVKLSKERRHIEIGKLYRDDREFAFQHKNAFGLARKQFFENNALASSDIISIKKDAIFTTKMCHTTRLDEFLNFRRKNTYSSYLRLGRKLEVYYGEETHVKGIGDENIALHEGFMLDFIRNFMDRMERCPRESVLRYCKMFADQYKRKELDIGYYRRFDSSSTYDLLSEPALKPRDYDDIGDIDITHNYFEVVVKLLKVAL